ncbi:MAG: EAL domain-containing protein [Halomonas sp.]|nr:EAL domain-containing protein [Halomonas sp.]
MLYEGLWQPILASIVGALLLVMSFWNSVPHAVLTGWLAGLLVVSLLRLMLSERFQRQTPEAQLRPRWLNAFAGGALLAGLAWGLAGWLLFSPSYDEYQAVLAIILAGIGAGSVTTLSSVWGVAALFLIPAILPLTMRYLAVGTPVSLVLAVMMGLFLGLTLVVSRRFSLIITENIALRIEGAGREAALRESESRYRSIFRSAPLGILHFDRQGRVLDCNDRFEQIIGARRECMLGLDMCRDLPDRQVGQAVEQALADGYGYYEGEYISVSSGRTIPLRAFFNGVRGADDEIIGGVAAIEDFTERKRAEALIHRQAFYDPLTDLPNRRLLIERLESAQQACRQTRTQGVVLFLDLDRFKSVNDSLGHAMGDRLLCETARRLSSLLRRGDMAARLSGDEFVILAAGLPECPDRAQQAASALAGRFLEALSAPYAIAGRTVRVTPSIGFALFPREAENVTDLLKYADTAMYQAKALGRARVCGYQPSMQDAVERRLSLESDLRHAIETDRLQLHYQPQVESDGRIMGVEALLRWPHETHGFISPGEFIPLAEESGLIADLGDWVLGEACRCLQRFDAGCLPRLSVNISPRHFAQSDFVERIQATVVDFGVAPERLLLELTEGVLIDHLQDAIAKMQALKRIGVGLAIDDFGTGYSSLSYLKRLPLDELKIDRSFVQDLDDDADAAIVQAIIAVSRHLQLSVVAEGVETTAQLERLQASGCRLFQGYYFHRPMPAEALAQVLAAQYSPH